MKKVIITGSMRSGTTLLANFLNAQNRCTVYRDFLHVQRTRDALGVEGFDTPLGIEEKKQALVDHLRRTRNISSDDLPDAVFPDRWVYDTLVDYYTAMLEAIAADGDILTGHKSTGAEAALGDLFPLVDDLVAIYIVRDPRDMCLSARRKWPNKPRGDLFDSCRRWVSSYQSYRDIADQDRFADRIHLIRYEDLILRTAPTLQALSDFLGYPIQPVSHHLDIHSPWKGNSSFRDNNRLFDSTGIGRWREQAPWLGHIVEHECTPLFQEGGYRVTPSSTPSDWLRAARNLPDCIYTEARYIRRCLNRWRAARS
jgi:hypothetical protein